LQAAQGMKLVESFLASLCPGSQGICGAARVSVEAGEVHTKAPAEESGHARRTLCLL
jgi:hypothetical protein